LKITGFHTGEGDAKPDWNAFAKSVPDIFHEPTDKTLRQAVDYILTHPPKKQVVKRGVLEWKDAAPTTALKTDEVLIYVRRTRNNLFHGGKFNGRWFEPQRSRELLQYSLVILRACLNESGDLKSAYEG
jgi:hypothetical protein